MRLRFWKRKPDLILIADTSEIDKEIEIIEQKIRVAELEFMERFKLNNDVAMDLIEMLIFGDQNE